MKKAKPRGRGGLIPPEGVDVTEWGVSPTRQTKRKHRLTSFARMYEAGEIDGFMNQAAQEIGEVFDYISRGLTAKSPANMDRVDCSGRHEPSGRVAYAHKVRYIPWANVLSRRAKRGKPPALETVFDIVIDGHNTSTVDDARRWRHGFAKYLVRRSLLEYAVMAGWAGIEELLKFDNGHADFAKRAA